MYYSARNPRESHRAAERGRGQTKRPPRKDGRAKWRGSLAQSVGFLFSLLRVILKSEKTRPVLLTSTCILIFLKIQQLFFQSLERVQGQRNAIDRERASERQRRKEAPLKGGLSTFSAVGIIKREPAERKRRTAAPKASRRRGVKVAQKGRKFSRSRAARRAIFQLAKLAAASPSLVNFRLKFSTASQVLLLLLLYTCIYTCVRERRGAIGRRREVPTTTTLAKTNAPQLDSNF